MHTVVIKVLPHPQFRGDWLVECRELLPNALWHESLDSTIYYAKLLGKECGGEVHVINPPRAVTANALKERAA